MDLANLMKSMSLNDREEASASNCHAFAVKINNTHTEIVFGNFSNQYMLIATHHEKIGSLLRVVKEQPGEGYSVSEPVYTVSIVFGAEDIQQQAAARHIAQQLDIQKPLMLFLCLKDYEVNTVKQLVDALLNIPEKDGVDGSGKTTYCAKVYKFYKEKLNRKVEVINLDPANENMTYEAAVDIMELVTVEEVMANLSLGPNGALMYCMEFLEQNFDWLLEKLHGIKNSYLLFDMPGQVELYTHHNSIKNVFSKLEGLSYHLCVVHMVDSHYCSDPTKFISTLLLSLSTMLQIGLPHVNVLSKADVLRKNRDKLDFGIDFYTDVLNLEYLLQLLDDEPLTKKYKKLNASVVGLIEEYGLVSFIPIDVHSERSLLALKNAVDKANGYVYGSGEERSIQALLTCAVGARTETERFDADFI